VFALVSREDPFPLVMLEAAFAGKPVVCFEGAGGAPEFVEPDAGFVVPYLDVGAMADRVAQLLRSEDLRLQLGQRGHDKVRRQHDVEIAGPQILGVIERFRERAEASSGMESKR
jgi:glycosyltransferase involved in cell wall biosynthesis